MVLAGGTEEDENEKTVRIERDSWRGILMRKRRRRRRRKWKLKS